jgi:enoyl-CoA hydratase/carnithine racemase
MKMILTGEPITAAEAHRLNIAHLVPSNEFEENINKILTTLASKGG